MHSPSANRKKWQYKPVNMTPKIPTAFSPSSSGAQILSGTRSPPPRANQGTFSSLLTSPAGRWEERQLPDYSALRAFNSDRNTLNVDSQNINAQLAHRQQPNQNISPSQGANMPFQTQQIQQMLKNWSQKILTKLNSPKNGNNNNRASPQSS